MLKATEINLFTYSLLCYDTHAMTTVTKAFVLINEVTPLTRSQAQTDNLHAMYKGNVCNGRFSLPNEKVSIGAVKGRLPWRRENFINLRSEECQ